MNIDKYEIYQVNLNPRKGHTQSGVRPCVIIQSNIFNKYAPTVMVVPLTTKLKDVFPSEFIIEPSEDNGLSLNSRFLGSQIITVDKEYLGEKLGFLEQIYHEKCDFAISVALGI